MQVGAVHALDVKNSVSKFGIVLSAERQTRRKKDGEGFVAFSDQICDLLNNWIADKLADVTDEHRRDSFPAVESTPNNAAPYCYMATQPSAYGEECPHDRDPEECVATERDTAPKCPSTVSPHAIHVVGSHTR